MCGDYRLDNDDAKEETRLYQYNAVWPSNSTTGEIILRTTVDQTKPVQQLSVVHRSMVAAVEIKLLRRSTARDDARKTEAQNRRSLCRLPKGSVPCTNPQYVLPRKYKATQHYCNVVALPRQNTDKRTAAKSPERCENREKPT